MARDGTGNYNLLVNSWNPAINAVSATAADWQSLINDLASAMSQSVSKDGQTTMTSAIKMGGNKITGVADGTNSTDAATFGQLQNNLLTGTCEGRLTLTSGSPITTSDVTGASIIYFSPYKGNKISLYDGSSMWKLYSFSESSISVPNLTQMNDVFIYDNAGTPTLELTAWTNTTTRATALSLQNGVYVKSSDTTRRYVGTFYSISGGSGTTEDSLAKRYLYNYYNRVSKPMKNVTETTDTWTYTTATFRQANANTANQLNFVVGVIEDQVTARVNSTWASNQAALTVSISVAIGLNSTTAYSGYPGMSANIGPANGNQLSTATFVGYPGLGLNYLAWLEYSGATGTTTWGGDLGGPTIAQSGINGALLL